MTSAEQASISLVPKVLKRGIEIAEHPSHKGRNYSIITITAPVIIGNQRVYMAVVVKKTGRYRYKTHRVFNPDGSNVKLVSIKKEGAR